MPLSDRDRRTLTIGGIVAGVLIVGVLLMNLLGGGGGGEAPLPPITGHPSSPTPTATATPTGGGGSPVAVFTGRDPFSIPPGFSVAPTSGGTTTPPPTSGGTTPPPTTPPPTTPPPTQPGGGSSGTHGGHQVVLLDAYTSPNGVGHAQVEVDGVAYTVKVGDRFGPNDRFELVSVAGNCATMLFGDESFTLCITPQK